MKDVVDHISVPVEVARSLSGLRDDEDYLGPVHLELLDLESHVGHHRSGTRGHRARDQDEESGEENGECG